MPSGVGRRLCSERLSPTGKPEEDRNDEVISIHWDTHTHTHTQIRVLIHVTQRIHTANLRVSHMQGNSWQTGRLTVVTVFKFVVVS